MIKDIDYYIQQAINGMKNVSDGGSPAYSFGDVVLVKYTITHKYSGGHHAREGAEEVAKNANIKNAIGVRTPVHLAIKRTSDDVNDICWVLQQAAKGKSFCTYCRNDNSQVQLEMQARLANAPDKHYEQLVNDIKELLHLGMELKPKNVFYDEDIKDGGFTIIDLLHVSGEPYDDSFRDVKRIWRYSQFAPNFSTISSYNEKVSDEQKEISKLQSFEIKRKIFTAMEKVIPNFENHRRWILRSMPAEELEYMEKHGTVVGNLTLTRTEEKQFRQITEDIISSSINKIKTGQSKYWQIHANEIRIDLDSWGMQDAWKYHNKNTRVKTDFEDEYDYLNACENDLQKLLCDKFDKVLRALEGEAAPNTPLAEAIDDLNNKYAEKAQTF